MDNKDFVANASHELRTPLTIIRGFAETLQDLPHPTTEQLHEITGKILRTCSRLDHLIQSLLTLADLENRSEEPSKTCDLFLLVEECAHRLKTVHPEVKLIIKSDLSHAQVRANGDFLDLALMNLLENGVKYSAPPANIEITVKKVEETLHCSVKDRGIGIPALDLPRIFDRFYAVDKTRSRKLGGVGLGLSIVKTIVERYKGKVLVASELGKGTTFTLLFPIR